MVAIPGIPRSSQAPDPRYNVENFEYSYENNTYTCPIDQVHKSNSSWYKGNNYYFNQYKTPACKKYEVRKLCTSSKRNGKIVQRSEFTPAIERTSKGLNNTQKYIEEGKQLQNIHMEQSSDNGDSVTS